MSKKCEQVLKWTLIRVTSWQEYYQRTGHRGQNFYDERNISYKIRRQFAFEELNF